MFIGEKDRDYRTPGFETDTKVSEAVLQVGGEYFFPTNTGLFLKTGVGGGTADRTVAGVSRPDIDIANSRLDVGVRQYVLPSMELHLRYHGESRESTQNGFPDETSDSGVVYFGVRGVIADVVGLMLESGGGKVEDKSGGLTIKSDIAALNAGIAGYIGKQLSIRLAAEVEEE